MLKNPKCQAEPHVWLETDRRCRRLVGSSHVKLWSNLSTGTGVTYRSFCSFINLMPKELCVYILECSDGSYYTGVTNDMDRRLWEHQTGYDPGCYTFFRRPVKLLFSSWFPDPLQAIAFEKQVKGWSRAKKEALINGEYEKLPGLSKSKNNPPNHSSTGSE